MEHAAVVILNRHGALIALESWPAEKAEALPTSDAEIAWEETGISLSGTYHFAIREQLND